MFVDVLLTTITLIVAVIGTLLRDPTRRVKIFLIGLAVIASVGSIVKGAGDASDKEFLKRAIISNLTPSNASYDGLVREVGDQVTKLGFDETNCIHTPDGMTCFLSSKSDKNKHSTLVFNRNDIAAMYANQIQRSSNEKVIAAEFSQSYDPKDLGDEFKDKVGILGTAVFFTIFDGPSDYAYADNFGVKIRSQKDGVWREVIMGPDELARFQAQKAPELFYVLEQQFREKFKDQVPQFSK